MNDTNRPYNEIDVYIATFSCEEHKEYRAAEAALDLASLLYHVRHTHRLTRQKAAEQTGLRLQAISRLEQAASNLQLGILKHYLSALGYHLEISMIDDHTGKVADKTPVLATWIICSENWLFENS
jgi:transcriptional regulator with XRE-family HTH domain